MKWVTTKSGPPVQTLRRMAEYQKAKKQAVYIVAFFDEFEVRISQGRPTRRQSSRRRTHGCT